MQHFDLHALFLNMRRGILSCYEVVLHVRYTYMEKIEITSGILSFMLGNLNLYHDFSSNFIGSTALKGVSFWKSKSALFFCFMTRNSMLHASINRKNCILQGAWFVVNIKITFSNTSFWFAFYCLWIWEIVHSLGAK